MPDFLNVDTMYPQTEWEETLDYVLKSVKAENPDFLLVAGDLLMGRWREAELLEKYAPVYYPAWIERMEAHGLKYYTAIGDHEIGDNPWPPERAILVPRFKEMFRNYMQMPLNGPDNMKGTAFYFVHKKVLFVSVDVFEKGKGEQGDIVARVSGEQLEWLENTFLENTRVEHVIVMGHTPVLGPVRKENSSGLMLEEGRRSPFWQLMATHHVDLYLCGEVHAITCIENDGVQQIAHSGLFGYNPKVNYLVAEMTPDRITLTLKELDIQCEGEKLWQVGKNRPKERIVLTNEIRKRGYINVGSMILDKSSGKKTMSHKTGCFDEKDNPGR